MQRNRNRPERGWWWMWWWIKSECANLGQCCELLMRTGAQCNAEIVAYKKYHDLEGQKVLVQ